MASGAAANFRLTTIVGPSGQRLRWTDSGLVASNGSRVSFTRDAEGRITSLITPDGEQIRYRYDADGHLAQALQATSARREDFAYESPLGLLAQRSSSDGTVGMFAEYDAHGVLLTTHTLVPPLPSGSAL